MRNASEKEWDSLRARIMGFGEQSHRKSYYPELQEKLTELERFKALLDQANDIIFLVHLPDGILADVSQSACRQLGFSRDELLASRITDLIPPRMSGVIDLLLRAGTYAKKEGFIAILTGKDGRELPVEISLHIVPFNDSDYAVLVARDITERQRAEEVLRESEERHRALVASSSDAILTLDEKRNILSCNRAFLDLFGFEEDEVKGRSIRVLHPSDESFRSLGEKLGASLDSTGSFRSEWELIHKDGKIIPVEGVISSMRSRDGSIVGYVAILRDITRRKRADEELKKYRDHLESMVLDRTRELEAAQKALIRKEKLKTLVALSSEIAHEIRNPLTSIGGFARRLQKKMPERPEAAIIMKESMRLEQLLNRIIEYLQPVEILPRRCSVNSVLADSVELLASELARERVACELDLAPELPSAFVDPEVLTKVFVNVIRNAIKAAGEFANIRIRTCWNDRDIYIGFRNSTPGTKTINPELLLLPFDGEGQSIGLPICFRLLEDMEGHFTFIQEGESLIVEITVPRYSNTGLSPGCETVPPAGGRFENIA